MAAIAQAERDAVQPADVLADLRSAQRSFAEAARLLARPSVLPLRFLPFAGRQLRSFDALVTAGADISRVSAGAVARVELLVGRKEPGPRDAAGLLRQVAELARSTEEALANVRFGPGAALVGPLATRRARLMDRVTGLRTGLDRGAAGATAAADLLGGPRRYLVLAANNSEMRAGSGMFLSAGVLQTEGGRLTLSSFRPTEELFLPPGAVALEGDLAARWDWLKPNQEWRNLGVSPRFDVTAPLAAKMWEASGGGPVDGVLALDPVALRAILAAVGPVEVDGAQITAENVVDRILHDQYVEYAGDPAQAARREQLGRIAQQVAQALEGRDWRPDRLGRELAKAARGRHLLAWSSVPAEQQGWVASGIDGALDGSSLLVAVLNRGGNKLDRFLTVRGDIRVVPGASGAEGELRLDVRNAVPVGEPAYVAGPEADSGLNEGDYLGLMAVSVPAAARDVWVEGDDRLAVAGRDGPSRVVASVLRLARGEARTVVVRFSLPAGPGSLRIEPSARQPGIAWTVAGRPFPDGARHTVEW